MILDPNTVSFVNSGSGGDVPTPPPPTSSDTGLSGGAIAGIAIGGVVAAAAVLGLFAFVMKKKKRGRCDRSAALH